MGCGSWLSSSWRRERARNVPRTAAMVTDTCAPRPVFRRELLTGWEGISRSDWVRDVLHLVQSPSTFLIAVVFLAATSHVRGPDLSSLASAALRLGLNQTRTRSELPMTSSRTT